MGGKVSSPVSIFYISAMSRSKTAKVASLAGILKDCHGREVVVPNEVGHETIHAVVYKELCQGKVLGDLRTQYQRIIQDWWMRVPKQSFLDVLRLPCLSAH